MQSLVRAGFQIPTFTYADTGPEKLFSAVAAQAEAAEAAGFDSVYVMDHFFQLPLLGGPDFDMLEGYTLLGALAARTSRVNVSTLVTGVTYRNPALVAKMTATLDVISVGRVICALGAAWYDVEHHALGFRFPPVAERFEHLADAVAICRAMFTGDHVTLSGTHHSLVDARSVPVGVRPGGPPIMVGGSGERKLIPLAALSADALNLAAGRSELARKIDVAESCLAEAGRGRDELNITSLFSLICRDTTEEAEEALRSLVAARGFDPEGLDDAGLRSVVTDRMIVGDTDTCTEQLAELTSHGLDGVIVNLPADDGDPASVHRAAAVFAGAGLIDG